MSTYQSNKGFTIVELLIVIVVIAILAAISIVAYNGIQNRGKSSAGQSLANSIAKKAEAWNTIQSSYPSFCQLATNTVAPTGTAPTCTAGGATGPAEAKLDDPSAIVVGPVTATTSDNGKKVGYTTSAVTWWKFDGTTGAQSVGLNN